MNSFFCQREITGVIPTGYRNPGIIENPYRVKIPSSFIETIYLTFPHLLKLFHYHKIPFLKGKKSYKHMQIHITYLFIYLLI
jgi:hypothetical protein